jgi:hypothetical protein
LVTAALESLIEKADGPLKVALPSRFPRSRQDNNGSKALENRAIFSHLLPGPTIALATAMLLVLAPARRV